MLDEVVGQRLVAVERLAWQASDGSSPSLNVGSVHLWFEGGSGLHLDGGSDWTLKWSISDAGDDGWMGQYAYDFEGRWVLRDSSREQPFLGLVGSALTSATPVRNEVNQVVGVSLVFEGRQATFALLKGELDTSPR